MGDLLPPFLPYYISGLSNRVKSKPLIFKFKWNFGWSLGQGDIFGSGQCTPQGLEIFFVADLTSPIYAPLEIEMKKLDFSGFSVKVTF